MARQIKRNTGKKTKKIILDNRNENWIKQLPGLMEKESLFIAVGSAHLAGESGIINLLKKAGYIVKPVMKQYYFERERTRIFKTDRKS